MKPVLCMQKIERSLEINLGQKTVCIDGRDYNFPVLIEINDRLEANLKFQFKTSPDRKTLVEQVSGMDEEVHFLLIDECKKALALDETLGQTGFCLIAGKGGQYCKSMPIAEDMILTCQDVRRLTGLMPGFEVVRVAHAGGGFNRMSHTNSHDALDYNLKQGFSHFELDFSFTRDGRLVCIHDYEENFESIFGFQTEERPTLDAFKSLVENAAGFKNCTLESLTVWMEQNPSVFIITDIKEDNLKALEMISEKAPDFKRRIIPQIYDPSNYNSVKEMGFEQVIWTLYLYDGSDEDVLGLVDTFDGPFAVTMPENRAKSMLPAKLAKKHIPTYVHTINAPHEAHKYINTHAITELYTDFLHPTELTLKH